MNILFLADAVFQDKPGGSRMAARELAVRLVKRGHRVTFLVGRQNDVAPADEISEEIRIVRYPGAGNAAEFNREGTVACKKLVDSEKFDVVHTHFAYAAHGPLNVVPSHVARVRTFHGPWDEEGWVEDITPSSGLLTRLKATVKRRLRYEVEAKNLRGSRQIIVLSDCFRNDVVNRFHIPAERVSKVPGGVDTDRFMPISDRAEARSVLNLPTDRPILFTVRRLAARMGIDNLILAVPAIIAKYPNVLLLIGGKGPAKEQLEKLVVENHLSENIKLLGFISDHDLPLYYQAADLFVLPTIALEGFGLVTAEALSSGTPVLGTPVGATPELLSPIDPRLIATGIHPKDLAEGIIKCIECIGNGAWKPADLARYARENFDWDRNAIETERIYFQACS